MPQYSFAKALLLSLVFVDISTTSFAFPSYGASLLERQSEEADPGRKYPVPENPPGPLKFNGTKLVNDKAHPWKPLRPGDIRGPCPGLNTLASHGYLPRDGVATPAQIINAVQEGFNMHNDLAKFVTYAAHLVDGNQVTNLLSIGGKTKKTGPDPPAPAIVGGLNTHGVFEGDSSMTRSDAFFGDNAAFNQTLFDQLVDFSNRFGGGFYNLTVAGELRHQLIQQAIATNPEFDFTSPRYFTAYAESSFPLDFFIDGRNNDTERKVGLDAIAAFFRDMKFPADFHRASSPTGAGFIGPIFVAHPTKPGKNVGGVNNYVLDPTSADFDTFCLLYTNFVNQTVRRLYPNPTGILRRNLAVNLRYFFSGIPNAGCEEIFPYGKVDV